MSVYVDALIACGKNPDWRWDHSCHLFADTMAELHGFAASIGMKRAWFQQKRSIRLFPHYDLNARRRAAAVAKGAIELDRRAFIAKVDALQEAWAKEGLHHDS